MRLQSQDATPANPVVVDGKFDHDEHVRQRDCAFASARHQRLQRLPAICQRCVLALQLAAVDGDAALERRLFPGGVYVLAFDGCDVEREYGVQHGVQR